jgi:hypothetical protein
MAARRRHRRWPIQARLLVLPLLLLFGRSWLRVIKTFMEQQQQLRLGWRMTSQVGLESPE